MDDLRPLIGPDRLPDDLAIPAEVRRAALARHVRTVRRPLDWGPAVGLGAPLGRPCHLLGAFRILLAPEGLDRCGFVVLLAGPVDARQMLAARVG